jgi:hypothetical protein
MRPDVTAGPMDRSFNPPNVAAETASGAVAGLSG